jgi:hypothetical protein
MGQCAFQFWYPPDAFGKIQHAENRHLTGGFGQIQHAENRHLTGGFGQIQHAENRHRAEMGGIAPID